MLPDKICPQGHLVAGNAASCPFCGAPFAPVDPARITAAGIGRWIFTLQASSALLLVALGWTMWVAPHLSHGGTGYSAAPVFTSAHDCAVAIDTAILTLEQNPDRTTGMSQAFTDLHAPSAEYEIFQAHVGAWLTVTSQQGTPAAINQVGQVIDGDCARVNGEPVPAYRPSPPPSTAPIPQMPPMYTYSFVFPTDPGPTRPAPTTFSRDAASNQTTAATLLKQTGLAPTKDIVGCVNDLVSDVVLGMTYGTDDTAFLAQTGDPKFARYASAASLVDEIATKYRIPASQEHQQTPKLARQGMLDVPDVSILARCAHP